MVKGSRKSKGLDGTARADVVGSHEHSTSERSRGKGLGRSESLHSPRGEPYEDYDDIPQEERPYRAGMQ